jgi:hypothetical protein
MKPCRKYRKPIALLSIDGLDSNQTAEVTNHLEQCESCRCYHKEISLVTQRLTSMETLGSPASRRRVGRVRELSGGTPVIPRWRFALPALTAVALTILVLSALTRHSVVRSKLPAQTQAVPIQNAPTDLLPTIRNYRAIANESLDGFDALLTQQARRPVPRLPSFSERTLALLSTAE